MDSGKSVVEKILREHNKLHLMPLIPQELMTLMVRFHPSRSDDANGKFLTSSDLMTIMVNFKPMTIQWG